MFNQLKSAFLGPFSGSRRKKREPAPYDAPLAPDGSFYAVGDIHGRADLLAQLLRLIDADALDTGEAAPRLVFLGDYIDRGEKSAEVLDWLFELDREFPDAVVCLRGNHEDMLLGFIEDPVGVGPYWLRNGGLQTLASYRIGGLTERSDAESFVEASAALEAALPAGMADWLRTLPTLWQDGNVCCVHGGMDPELGPDEQRTRSLLWGHPDFFRVPRRDGLWVVHGHTVVDTAHADAGRIAVDTGAYHSGRLSAVLIAPGTMRVLAT